MEMTNAMWEAAAVSAENWPAKVSISNWFYIVKGKRGKPDTAYG